MFLIRSSTRGRGRQGEGEIQFFPPIVPGNRDRKKKISSSPRRKETSFPTIQSDSSRLSRLLSIDRRRNRRGNRTRSSRKHRREKGGEEEREKVERISFDEIESRPFFFAKPLLPLHSLSCCRFLSSDEWKRFAFYGRASRRDPISLAHHHCSRLSKIYPIDGIVPSPRLRAIHGA